MHKPRDRQREGERDNSGMQGKQDNYSNTFKVKQEAEISRKNV